MTGYTPKRKSRPPCYGCKHLVRMSDDFAVEYFCYAKSKLGHRITGITRCRHPNELPLGIDAAIDERIRRNMRPVWCPEERKNAKAGRNNG